MATAPATRPGSASPSAGVSSSSAPRASGGERPATQPSPSSRPAAAGAQSPNQNVPKPAALIGPAVALGSPAIQAAARAPAPDGLVLRPDEVILFLGDELMDAGDPRTSTSFPFLVETFLTVRYPDLRLRYVYAGWRGDTAGRALLRLERDVLSRKPTTVVICLGLNDPEYVPFSEERLAHFKRDLGALIRRIEEAGARVWLISPPSVREDLGHAARIARGGQPTIVNLRGIQYNATLARYAQAVREAASEAGMGFVDWYAASLKMRRAARPGKGPWQDGRLPPPQGHALIAAELLRAWGAQPIEVAIDLKWNGPAATVTSHLGAARTVPVRVDAGGKRTLLLTGLPLPWPMPGGPAGALQPEWEAADLCRFLIRIPDPPARGARLRLEGRDSGEESALTLTAAQLKNGCNLATTELLRTIRPAQSLLQTIGLKNHYRYSTWRRQELHPAREPELADAQRQLVAALYAYASGYERIVWRMAKTFEVQLALAEAVAPERVPTAPPIGVRPATIPATQPATMPATQPTTMPATRPATAPAMPASRPATQPQRNPPAGSTAPAGH